MSNDEDEGIDTLDFTAGAAAMAISIMVSETVFGNPYVAIAVFMATLLACDLWSDTIWAKND